MDLAPVTRTINSRRRSFVPASLAGFVFLASLLMVPASRAQDSTIHLEKAQAKIEFSLGSTLHTVHGTFALKNNEIRYDPASGKISGDIVVDATSGESGNSSRDSRMHREILETANFPEISFTPTHIKGSLAPAGTSRMEVTGQFHLHGRDHELTLPVEVTAEGQNLQLTIHFAIPYVDWGIKNPSNFLLRASDTVEIDIHATGRVESATASN
jgi:polyisoprenoid-binding protein YceI